MNAKNHILLSEMPRKNAFDVPDDYFIELPTTVLSMCLASKMQKKKSLFLTSKPLWWSVAACFVLLLGIWFVLPNTTPSSNSILAQTETSSVANDRQEYLAHYAEPALLEDELFQADVSFLLSEELTEDEVLSYLDYEHLHYEDLY